MTKNEYKKFSNAMDKQLSTVYHQILPLIDIIEERIKNGILSLGFNLTIFLAIFLASIFIILCLSIRLFV